jgi:peroxiredoxin
MLEDRIRKIRRADPDGQRQTSDYVRMYLQGMLEHGLEPRDLTLAQSAAQAFERTGQELLAADSYRHFVELIANTKDERLAEFAKRFEAAASRLDVFGKKLERLEGTNAEGAKFDWAAYRGKVVLIFFWDSSNLLCQAELAAIKRYFDIYHDLDFDVVGISVDRNRQALEEFLGKRQLPWVTLHEQDADSMHPMAQLYGVTAIPSAFLIDRSGTVVSLHARGGQLPILLRQLLGPSYSHGKALAIAGRWDQLAEDFEKIVEMSPENGGCWHSLAVAYLQAQDTEGYTRTCRRAFQRLSDSHIWAQAVMVQVCSLAPDAGIDPSELTQVAEAALAGSDNATMRLAKGMDHYRCGRFEKALESLPTAGDAFQVPVSLLFQAMAQQRLGNTDEARRLLAQAVQDMEQRVPEIEGPPLADYMPARWVVWATHRVLRREAEKLILADKE